MVTSEGFIFLIFLAPAAMCGIILVGLFVLDVIKNHFTRG